MSKRCPGNRSGVMRFNAQALLYPMRVSRCFQTRRVFLACADFSLFGQMSLARQVMTLTISSNCLKRIGRTFHERQETDVNLRAMHFGCCSWLPLCVWFYDGANRHGPNHRDGNRCAKCGYRWGQNYNHQYTSELQSRLHLVCRLLLEKKKAS